MNPVTNAIASAAVEPIKTMVLGTAHEVTIKVVGQATLGQKLGYFLLGAVGASLPVGFLFFFKGVADGARMENERLREYSSQGDEERRKSHTSGSN